MKLLKFIIALLAISVLSVSFPCSHTPRCKTFHKHKTKIKKLPGNGIQKTNAIIVSKG